MPNKKITDEELLIAAKLGNRLQHFRIDRRLTQDELAKSLGITQRSVSEWENGRACIPTRYLVKICQIYKIKLSYFDPIETQIEQAMAAYLR